MGRKPLLAAATLDLLGLTLPIYLLICRGGPVGLLPTRVRASGLAITYGVGSALFGGTAPFMATLLVQRTGNPVLPAYYATAVILAAAIAVLPMGETAFRPLDADDA